jgi:hypothetical protein
MGKNGKGVSAFPSATIATAILPGADAAGTLGALGTVFHARPLLSILPVLPFLPIRDKSRSNSEI